MNVLSGFFISWMVWIYLVAPLFDYETSYLKGFAITSIFTVSSLIRAFVIRRIMNWHTQRKLNEQYYFVAKSTEGPKGPSVPGSASLLP